MKSGPGIARLRVMARYWVYHKQGKKVLGPYPPKRIMGMAGFSTEWKVAPAGAATRDAWALIKDVPEFRALLTPPAQPAAAASKKPA